MNFKGISRSSYLVPMRKRPVVKKFTTFPIRKALAEVSSLEFVCDKLREKQFSFILTMQCEKNYNHAN